MNLRWYRLHSSTPPAKKLTPLTTWSRSIKCVSAAEHHTAVQYSKPTRQNPDLTSLLERLIMIHSPELPEDTKPSEAALERGRGCCWNVILSSNVTQKHQGPQSPKEQFHLEIIGAAEDSLCLTWRLCIIVLVLLSINLIPQRIHHSLTLLRSRFRDSATATQIEK